MGHAGAVSRLHEVGEEGEEDDGEEDALGAEMAVEVDLVLGDIAGEA